MPTASEPCHLAAAFFACLYHAGFCRKIEQMFSLLAGGIDTQPLKAAIDKITASNRNRWRKPTATRGFEQHAVEQQAVEQQAVEQRAIVASLLASIDLWGGWNKIII